MKTRQAGRPGSHKDGFALIVTLVMMVLLVILALGLLSLSTISLRNSAQGGAAAVARSNARLALMMAVGELQKQMGPDSRISAPAEIAPDTPGSQPHLTAVYEAWTQKAAGDNSPESPASRKPKFLGWLASGSNAAGGGPIGTEDRIPLIGPGTLGEAAAEQDKVRVPMHEITTGNQRGRLAWWTADESVKAKVNAGPDAVTATSFGAADALFNSQAAANVGHRAIPKLEQFEWKEGKRGITVSTSEVNVAAGLGSRGLGNAIHDLTVHSAGLLTDVRAGRLRRDLSNLLARPIGELEDKPLFLADGRLNRFSITPDGAVSNSPVVGANTPGTPGEWGINLEELGLFHSLHRQLTWNGGSPSLATKNSAETAIRDRHFIYSKPTVEAVQFILSLKAVPTGATYKMQMMLDGVVVLSNPNDVRIQVSPGLDMPLQLLNVPYDLKWNIRRSDGTTLTTTSDTGTFDVFRGHVEGGAGGVSPAGFVLEPGEAACFGSSTATGFELNLKRGFEPSGGVTITGWDLNADNLKSTDMIDFELKKSNSTAYSTSYTYYNFWLGPRNSGKTPKGWQLDASGLAGPSTYGGMMDQMMPISVRPPQVRPVSDFVGKPQPVMLFSFTRNVEQASSATPPDGFASRPLLMNDPALSGHGLYTDDLEGGRHAVQSLITAEPLNYQFRSLAAGAGGRNIYQGGARQPNLGGSFNVIKRRIPIAPPLSLGAFQNAIAFGLIHMNEGAMPAIAQDPIPANADAMSPWRKATSLVTAKSIGNSFCPPYLSPDLIYRPQSGDGRLLVSKAASDYSWIANTALWDSWFLSGIVDGTGAGSSSLLSDPRSPRAQFRDLAEGKGVLRNKRFLFHPYKAPNAALDELFTGENFKPGALNTLAKYLLVDGAFNVNSVSVNAWAAFISSVRDHELLTGNGTRQKFLHPYGTLGYATNTATSGTEGDWSGLRDLTSAEITTLATEIVKQVKARGPFLSLADFVNRRPNSSDPTQQVVGALQAAIDLSGLNDRFSGTGRALAPTDFAAFSGGAVVSKEPKAVRAVGAAGHLNQANLLTALGSQITVRADTFTIRTYGDARDASGKVLATAWCEAVVQRLPEYLDPLDAPEAQDGWPSTSSKLAPMNAMFGRRFVIRSFRWLSSVDV